MGYKGSMKKPKRRGDRHELIRNLPDAIVPPKYKEPIKIKNAPPESELQEEVNKTLKRMRLYYFRLSAQVLSGHGDRSVGGWPDNPIIIPIAPGVSLLFPLELKKMGETMRPNQIEMQERIGTICADNWGDAWDYIQWAEKMGERFKTFFRKNGIDGYKKPAKFE